MNKKSMKLMFGYERFFVSFLLKPWISFRVKFKLCVKFEVLNNYNSSRRTLIIADSAFIFIV